MSKCLCVNPDKEEYLDFGEFEKNNHDGSAACNTVEYFLATEWNGDMLKRNLIYTAITRAKKKVIIIGEKRALMAGIHKNDSSKRNTQLAERIKMYVDENSGKDDTK